MQRQAKQRALKRLGLVVAVAGMAGCAKGKDPPAPTAKVLISGGSFAMGTSNVDPCGSARISSSNGGPSNSLTCDGQTQSAAVVHTVAVKSFCIDEHEVTNLQFRHCVALEDCTEPNSTNIGNVGEDGFIKSYYSEPDKFGSFPVVGVTHAQAQAFCESKGGSLPTEAQWEFAASSRGQVAGDQPLWELANAEFSGKFLDGTCTGEAGLLPCGAKALAAGRTAVDVTAEGVKDMAGNVREWTLDDFDFLAGCDQTDIESKYAVSERRATYAPVDGAFDVPPPGLVSDSTCYDNGETGYQGGCSPSFLSCLRVCGTAFVNSTAPVAEKLAIYRQENCAARSPVSNLVDVDMVTERDACTTECTDGGGDMTECLELCTCLTGDLRDNSFDDTQCLGECTSEFRACADSCDAGIQSVCLQTNPGDGQPNRMTPLCQPREGRTGEEPHVRPEAFNVERIADTYVVRGGVFNSAELCDARPSARRFEKDSSPFTGFRCVYPASACQ
jgi:formylglycine-generating enzyme required for sulfatase activity